MKLPILLTKLLAIVDMSDKTSQKEVQTLEDDVEASKESVDSGKFCSKHKSNCIVKTHNQMSLLLRERHLLSKVSFSVLNLKTIQPDLSFDSFNVFSIAPICSAGLVD